MHCVVFERHGGPEVLRYAECPRPRPGPGEVLVAVRAVSVDRTLDIEVRQRGAGWPIPMPHVLGADPAGVVVERGPGVEAPAVGQRVVAFPLITCGACAACRSGRTHGCAALRLLGVHRNGGYAELVAVPAGNLLPVPEGLGFAAASASALYLPVAWNLLRHLADLRAGETVLVMGAGGGLGTCGIRVAKALGARVIAAAGSEWKLARCRELGADETVDYSGGGLADRVRSLTDGRGADVVFENIGSPALWPDSVQSLAPFGRLVTCGTHGGGVVEVDLRQLYRRHLSIRCSQGAPWGTVQEVFAAVEQGWLLPPPVGRTFPLEEAAAAHAFVAGRANFGRVCLLPEPVG